MISQEKFLEKLKNSGLSPKETLQLYWSVAYCIILKLTGKNLSLSEIEKEYKTQDSLFKKIDLAAIQNNEKDIIEGLFANEKEIREKVKTGKLAPHESSLNNRISHYMLLLRFTKEDEKEAANIRILVEQARIKQAEPESKETVQKSAEKSAVPAPEEPVIPPKKGKSLLTIAALTTLGITGALIVNKFVKKDKKEEEKK